MAEPVDIHPRCGKLKRGNSEACDAGRSVNKDVCLATCECVTEAQMVEGTYNLEVPVCDIQQLTPTRYTSKGDTTIETHGLTPLNTLIVPQVLVGVAVSHVLENGAGRGARGWSTPRRTVRRLGARNDRTRVLACRTSVGTISVRRNTSGRNHSPRKSPCDQRTRNLLKTRLRLYGLQ